MLRSGNILEALASLRLTVVLMALSMVLIFVGTLAQAEMGVWQAVDQYFRSPIAWISLQLFVPRQLATIPLAVPFPGGLTIGLVMALNLVAAHALRFRMAKKRIGIIGLHAGLIVLLAGEFATGMFADEGLMSIDEGGSANYVEDIREVELAVMDRSDAGQVRVAAIPQSMVEETALSGEPIEPRSMPFNVTIDEWMPNARLLVSSDGAPATDGVGLEAVADELPQVRGADGAQTNAPAAYVTVQKEGEALGTWLLWSDLIDPQTVTVDGQEYAIALRYRRTYKPYTIELIDFRHDKFTGTEIARNFSSRVRVIEPERGTDREVLISMNNPLRYGGDTFYQASYKPDGSGTVLQVVRNPGSTLPYIACALVSGGLLLHFGIVLIGFIQRENKHEQKRRGDKSGILERPLWQQLLPWGAALVAVALTFSNLLRPVPESPFNIESFSTLPVSSNGRVKPMDTAARHIVKVASGRESVASDGSDGKLSAAEFTLQLMADPESVSDLPVVRVDHPDVLSLIGKTPEEGGRLPLSDIQPHWQSITTQAQRASEIPSKQRDLFQRSVLELHQRVNGLLAYSSMVEPYAIPPFENQQDWQPFHTAYLASRAHGAEQMGDLSPGLAYYTAMMTAFSDGNAELFNGAVAGYQHFLRQEMPHVMRKASFEVWFNRTSLFIGTMAVYILAFLLLCCSLLVRFRPSGKTTLAESLRLGAIGMLWGGFVIHTLAIAVRMWLMERPPVTNLYSSAVFVGWAAVLTALFMERFFRMGIAAMSASAVGFATLVVAHNLGSDGDTMQMMQAVLDSNFWLATHVITITLGYSATFLAGTLAIIYLILGVLTKWLTKDRARALTRMVYGTVCFALLLSFVGTVLGGIWADQSWGRFWGWDPKENGAALVVLINAMILHARWGGMIGQRGIMILAVAGNIVTAWSWFGTNMLGIGLHSYGFMDSAVFWLMTFVLSQLALISLGLLPPVLWRSAAGHKLRSRT